MAFKSLILGIIFSIGIFAVKSGVGLHYYLSKTASTAVRARILTVYAISYLILFLISHKVLAGIDMVQHIGAIQAFIQSGMIIHLIMAGLLFLWGLHLLRHEGKKRSHGWLMLVVPCPVCVMVIFLSLGFLTACFPDSAMTATLLLFFIFLLLNGLTVLVMNSGNSAEDSPPEIILGSAMLLISVYFLLSISIMPQFADTNKIFRMSLALSDTPTQQIHHLLFLIVCMFLAFISSFTYTFFNIRRKS